MQSGFARLPEYRFRDTSLLKMALTHRSHSVPHNERLEFLGDSILNCAVAVLLYHRFPDLPEGDLSRLRANLVKQDTLHALALELDLGERLRLGEGELKSGGQSRPSILADAFEALIGAIYLDTSYQAALDWIAGIYKEKLAQLTPGPQAKDAKTRLQEYLQARRQALPAYQLVDSHAQGFEVACEIPERGIRTTGTGPSRRTAEQEAAKKVLLLLPDLDR